MYSGRDYDSLGARVAEYLSEDTNGVKIGIYAVSGLLFGIAYYKKRPITKFTKPSQIPDHFIKQRLRQRGTVAGIEPHLEHGSLLQINHHPPLSFLRGGSGKYLPVKLAGVSINSNGLSWLQTVTSDKSVEFLPLTKHSDHVECLVFLHDDTIKTPHKDLDVAEALLSLGFARTTNNLPLKMKNDKKLERYFKLLHTVENHAKKNREGEWNWRLPKPMLPIRMWQQLWKQVSYNIMPQSRRLPPLVRP